MIGTRTIFSFAFATLCALMPLLNAGDARGQATPEIILSDRLAPDPATTGAQYGRRVDISLDTVVVGGPGNGSTIAGTAQIFYRDPTSADPLADAWDPQDLPTPIPTPGTGDKFGHGVGVDQNMAVIGAPGSNSVYVYRRTGETWAPDSLPSFTLPGVDDFGVDVRVSEEHIIVGSNDNAAYIYTKQGGEWAGTALSASGTKSDFGKSVDISGSSAIVGDPIGSTAYLYHQSGSNWVEDDAFSLSLGSGFGGSVSISGDYAIVGASSANSSTGLAKIYYRDEGTWTEQTTLTASDGMSSDWFGCSVDIGENYAIVGASGGSGSSFTFGGAAYIFQRSGSAWVEIEKLVPDSLEYFIEFGSAVALNEGGEDSELANFIVGARGYSSYVGTAYAYELDTSASEQLIPGDANLDGIVDADDAAALAFNWLKASGAVWREGDFNGDGAVDDYDATVLAANWQTGIPTASVPEPQTLLLLAICSACLCFVRRRMS